MPKSLETLLLTDCLMDNALSDFIRLAEILIPIVTLIDDEGADADMFHAREQIERAIDIIILWCP